MADGKAQSHSKPLWVWLLTLLLVEIACVLGLVSPAMMSAMLEGERAIVASHLGASAEAEIRTGADKMFVDSVIKTGFREASYRSLIGHWDQGQAASDVPFDDRGAGQWMLGRLRVAWGVFYLLLYRLSALLSWLPALVPIFGGVLIDAAMRWKASQWRFTFASPTIHSTGLTVLSLVMTGTLAIFVAPVRITPLVIPIGALIAALAIWAIVGNMTKRF